MGKHLHILELDKLERNHLLAIELLGCQHNILDIEQLEELILPNHIKILLVFSKEPKSHFPENLCQQYLNTGHGLCSREVQSVWKILEDPGGTFYEKLLPF